MNKVQNTTAPGKPFRTTHTNTHNVTVPDTTSLTTADSGAPVPRLDGATIPALAFGLTIGGLVLVFGAVIFCLLLYIRRQRRRPSPGRKQRQTTSYGEYYSTIQAGQPEEKPQTAGKALLSGDKYLRMDGNGKTSKTDAASPGTPVYIEVIDSPKKSPKRNMFSWIHRSSSKDKDKAVTYMNVKDRNEVRKSDDVTSSDPYYKNTWVQGDTQQASEESGEIYENT